MASHLACIGLPVDGPDALAALVGHAGRAGAATPGAPRRRTWTDPGGARLSVELDRTGAVRHFVPGFAGEAAPVTVDAVRHDGLHLCDLLDDAGDVVTRAACELDRPGAGRLGLRLTGFAEAAEYHPDAAAYLASQRDEPRFAAEHWLPVGTFAERVEARVVLGATVLAARHRVTAHTGTGFVHVHARTLGFELDVVVAAGELPQPPPAGSVLVAQCYLVGEVLTGPVPVPVGAAPAAAVAAAPVCTGAPGPSGGSGSSGGVGPAGSAGGGGPRGLRRLFRRQPR